jgi:hypothetical protein
VRVGDTVKQQEKRGAPRITPRREQVIEIGVGKRLDAQRHPLVVRLAGQAVEIVL